MKRNLSVMLVLSVLAGLMTVAGCLPSSNSSRSFSDVMNKANRRTCERNQREVEQAIEGYYAENEVYPTGLDQLTWVGGETMSDRKCPAGGEYIWVQGPPPYIRCRIPEHNIR